MINNIYTTEIPYIFLDFDGVLTNYIDEFGSFKSHDITHYGVSKSCYDNLIKLVQETNAKIILSSNWRKFDDVGPLSYWHTANFGKVPNPLPNLKKLLGQYYIGCLPPDRHITKSQALELWFEYNNLDYKKCKYVIFDDDLREGYNTSRFKDNFILTNYETGLTKTDCDKAKIILQ